MIQQIHGDDSTTYAVSADYHYDYEGVTYYGDRVSFSEGSDNIGSFHQDTFAFLQQQQRQQKVVTVWVNPSDPDQAVLIRDMRWGLFAFYLLFFVVFSGVGGRIIMASLWSGRKLHQEQKEQAAYPQEPWRWKKHWRNGVIRCESHRMMWFAIGFAVFWNLISAPLLFVLPEEILDKQNHAALFGLLFPVVGFGFAIWAVYLWRRWQRYGHSTLTLRTFPASPGHELNAELHSPTMLSTRELTVQLLNVRELVRRNGKKSRSEEHILWEDIRHFPILNSHRGMGSRVDIRFPIPADTQAHDDANPSNQVLWRLVATAEVPGVDYRAQFDVPVFHTSTRLKTTSLADHDKAASLTTFSATLDQSDGDWRNTGILHEIVRNGHRLFYPQPQNRGTGVVLLLLTLAFGSIGIYLLSITQWLIGLVFSFFALLMAAGSLFTILRRDELIISRGHIHYHAGWLGRGRMLDLATDEVRRIHVEKSGSIGQRLYYRIVVERWGQSQKLTLLQWVPGRRDAHALADEIARLAGINMDSNRI